MLAAVGMTAATSADGNAVQDVGTTRHEWDRVEIHERQRPALVAVHRQ